MSVYLVPIQAALILFPLLAALITLPYIIYQYRHYGSILFLRVAIVYSFIFYLLCCYFLVSLPLPPIEEVAQYTSPTMQLVPFKSLMEFTTSTSLVWDNPATYLTALNEPSLYLIAFNILLTVPFGIFLRYYFQYSWKKTLLFSLLLTLSFECLQLSALFGIYPRPYRLFDVDDLITNTFGGMLGYALTPLVAHFLPSRKQLDEEALEKGRQVSSLRRVLAFFTDILAVLLLASLCYYVANHFFMIQNLDSHVLALFGSYAIACVLLLMVLPICTKGKTLGKTLVKIRLVRMDEQPLRWYQYPAHFLVLYLILLPTPLFCLFCFLKQLNAVPSYRYLWLIGLIVLAAFYLFSILQGIQMLFHHEKRPIFTRLANVKNISTIPSVSIDTTEQANAEFIAKELTETQELTEPTQTSDEVETENKQRIIEQKDLEEQEEDQMMLTPSQTEEDSSPTDIEENS